MKHLFDPLPPLRRRVFRPSAPRVLPPAARLVIGLALLVLVGTLLLMLPGIGETRSLAWNEALFTATSALSVTGLSIITPPVDLSIGGQMVLLLLIQIGGVGFMVLAVVIFRLLGRKVLLLDRLALRDSFGLLDPAMIIRLTQRVILTVLLVELLGALLLWLHWADRFDNQFQALFYAVFHAVSSFCNAGFDLFNGNPQFPDGLPRDTPSLFIMGSLILMGGLGIPVLADLIAWPRRHKMSLHSRLTLRVVLLLLIFGSIGIFFAERQPNGLLSGLPLPRQLALSTFQSISVRTAGFSGFASFESMTSASKMLMMVLMFIGCAPASMGGGITTGTFVVLVLSLWGYARGYQTAHVEGRSIALGTMRRASAVLTISLVVVCTATWLILLTHPTTLDAALFEVVSAFATCGLTLNFTGKLNVFGQLLIIVVMFWGRLGALTIITALTQTQSHAATRITYPEEQILIG